MSNFHNEILLEGLFEDGLELSTEQLAKALDLTVDALGTRSFPDCKFDGDVNHKILFTGYDIFSHDELAEMYANSQFETRETGYA
jgi:hypothetical protein